MQRSAVKKWPLPRRWNRCYCAINSMRSHCAHTNRTVYGEWKRQRRRIDRRRNKQPRWPQHIYRRRRTGEQSTSFGSFISLQLFANRSDNQTRSCACVLLVYPISRYDPMMLRARNFLKIRLYRWPCRLQWMCVLLVLQNSANSYRQRTEFSDFILFQLDFVVVFV